MSINRVMISGNLTRDADLSYTAGGTAVCRFCVAVNERRKNGSGEWEDYPNFVDCTVFGKRGEALAQYLAKGAKVAVEGRLRFSSWERDGQRRSKLDVTVDEIEFTGTRKEAGGNAQPGAVDAVRGAFGDGVEVSAYADEDLPF